MQIFHTPAAVSAVFDDPNLITYAGLVPVMPLAEPCNLSALVTEQVKLPGATSVDIIGVDSPPEWRKVRCDPKTARRVPRR
jgi:hypothetical protein